MLYRDWFKRPLDIVGALVLLLALAVPLGLLLAVLQIGHRPVLFRQVRLGRHGRQFTIYKLRTMKVEQLEPAHACTGRNDPRVTRIGHWLRRSRVDELPQLINVLRGDMSLIGPRPQAVDIPVAYGPQIERRRVEVRPGITGLAKARHPNRAIDDPLSVADDLTYGRCCGFWLDLKIMLLTLWALPRGALNHHPTKPLQAATDEASA